MLRLLFGDKNLRSFLGNICFSIFILLKFTAKCNLEAKRCPLENAKTS